jgi:DNA polymerase-3 subunit delta
MVVEGGARVTVRRDLDKKKPAEGGPPMPVVTKENFSRLLTEIEQGTLAPIYLLFGESYLVGSALTQLTERLVPESQRGTNLQVVDGAQADFRAILDGLNTFALFSGRKAAVVLSARIFSSRADLSGLFARSRAAYETGALDAAARTLLEALAYAGWSLDDLASEAWRGIPAHLWQQTFGVDRHEPDMVWIDAVVAHAMERGMAAPERRDEAALLEAALRRGFPSNHCLVVTAEAVDKRRSLYRLIEEKGVIVDFTVAAGTGREARTQQDALLKGLIRQTLGDAGKTMEPEALRLLMERVGFNLWALNNQLQQLIAFIGPEPAILREHVETISHHVREEALYELTAAVTAGSCASALALLYRLLDQGYHALQVLAALGNEIRRLIAARDFIDTHLGGRLDPAMPYGAFQKTVHPLIKSRLAAGSPLLSMHPFALHKTLVRSAAASLGKLTGSLHHLFAAELALKSTGVSPRAVLESVVLRICRAPETIAEA